MTRAVWQCRVTKIIVFKSLTSFDVLRDARWWNKKEWNKDRKRATNVLVMKNGEAYRNSQGKSYAKNQLETKRTTLCLYMAFSFKGRFFQEKDKLFEKDMHGSVICWICHSLAWTVTPCSTLLARMTEAHTKIDILKEKNWGLQWSKNKVVIKFNVFLLVDVKISVINNCVQRP